MDPHLKLIIKIRVKLGDRCDLTLCHQPSITCDHNVNSDQDLSRANTKQFDWGWREQSDIHDQQKVRPEDEV